MFKVGNLVKLEIGICKSQYSSNDNMSDEWVRLDTQESVPKHYVPYVNYVPAGSPAIIVQVSSVSHICAVVCTEYFTFKIHDSYLSAVVLNDREE